MFFTILQILFSMYMLIHWLYLTCVDAYISKQQKQPYCGQRVKHTPPANFERFQHYIIVFISEGFQQLFVDVF